MKETIGDRTPRQMAVAAFAVIGFIAVVAFGIWLAIYSARFVPAAVTRIGAAAVSLSQIFVPNEGGVSVVPTGSSTLPFGNGTSSPTAPASGASGGNTTAGTPSSGVYPIGTTTAPTGPLSGLPDLTVSITAAGYLATSSTSSFVEASTVAHGARPAVKFTITNVGTNATGSWSFYATIPTATSYLYQSLPQQNLNPGDHIDYILGFDQANPGNAQTISVTADGAHGVSESNENNNTASVTLTILGN